MSAKSLAGAALIALSTFALPSLAGAATFQLVATSVDEGQFTSFTIVFDDGEDGDMLFSIDELVSFSGMTHFGGAPLTTITNVPEIPTFTTGTGNTWLFESSGSSGGVAAGFFNYSRTEITPPVSGVIPLPASVLMLLSALGALGLSRGVARRRLTLA